MGLFDDLKNALSGVIGAEKVGFSDDENTKETKIPEEYSEFPRFEKYTRRVDTKNTSSYTRCTMVFKNITQEEVDNYINKIKLMGYLQGSKVRFDKESTYIIVDYKETFNELVVVFHIKR